MEDYMIKFKNNRQAQGNSPTVIFHDNWACAVYL